MRQKENLFQGIDKKLNITELINHEDSVDKGGKCSEPVRPQCLKREEKNVYRRAFSESTLLEILDYNLQAGISYHCISGGNIDSLSYLKHIIREQVLDYVLFSTW